MTSFDVLGVTINFPFEPYPCQVDYMKKVIECLQKNVNGILESPTGTGKTLCLLCSTLAWLQDKKTKVCFNQQTEISNLMPGNSAFGEGAFNSLSNSLKSKSDTTWGGTEFAVPKIIYATRTHSQLSQAVQEMKRTAYNGMNVAVIGSREQMCIHEKVRREQSNTSKVHMCRNKVNSRSCHYYNNLDEIKKSGDLRNNVGTVVDVEDLVRFGEKNKCCPYYMARELKSDADIIFLPYNYLLDPKTRKAHGVELQGNILIFDEAHNLEKICEDSSSFDLSSIDIATAMEEVTLLAEKLVSRASDDLQSIELSTDSSIVPEFNLDDLLKIKGTLQDLEKYLDSLEVPKNGVTHPGVFIFEVFGSVGVTFESKNEILDVLEKTIAYLNNDGMSSSLHTKGSGLTKFSDMLKVVFCREVQAGITLMYHQKCISHSYRVHIHTQENFKKKKTIDSWTTRGDSDKQARVLSYWCFSPGHCMGDLVSHQVKCILLTSGTLSPINSFTAEMQISFPVQLENPHVIQKHQVWISTLGKGPDGATLNSSYENRDKDSYKSSLGNTLVNFARVVPNGLLIFFPSYPVMEKCLDNWRSSTIWSRITQYKPIFVEPRGKDAFHQAMNEFYEKIRDPSLNGAIFAAVCRGKVSEGLDFSDINGRAVVITGLPFPPMMDSKVILKMKYLDEMKGKQGFQSLTGREWYRQQASRAVNQAIGRVIRHKEDFGAIILCDNRFSSQQSQNQLPVWVRPHVKQYAQFGGAIRDLMMFFKTAEKCMPVIIPKARINAPVAYFTPSSNGNLSKTVLEKASTVTNHMLGYRQQQEDASSLARLKIQYEGTSTTTTVRSKGLLDALESTEKPTCDQERSDVSSQMSSYQSRQKPSSSKKRILIKKSSSSSSEKSSSVLTNTPASCSIIQSAEAYVVEVKKKLDAESYKLFSKTLLEYKSKEDFSQMSAVMCDLFLDQSTNHPLFRAFYKFVRPQHKEKFSQLCENLTGQSCGYKPEDGLSKKRISSLAEDGDGPNKRQKLKPIQIASSFNSLQSTEMPSTSTIIPSDLNTGSTTCQPPSSIIPPPQASSSIKRNKSGSICCSCGNPADVPFISGCDHVCCFLCWKNILKGDKLCPKCQTPVKRRHMKRLLYT